MLNRLTAGAAVFALSTLPAMADSQLSVYDSHNKLVGPLVGQNLTVIALGGFQQYVSIAQEGYVDNAVLYFGGPHCQGTTLAAYDKFNELFPHAQFDGHTLYYLNPNQDANLAIGSKLDDAGCTNLPQGQTLGSTGAYPITAPFVPPFTVR